MIKHYLFPLAAAVAACLCLSSCKEKVTPGVVGGGGVDPTYIPMFKGTSTFMEKDTEDVIMYQTEVEDEFVILGFFGAEEGGLGFKWDRQTNIITILESSTGLDSYTGPVIAITKQRYASQTGKPVADSFYAPIDNVFSFQVYLEYGEADGTIIYLPVNAYYRPKEVLSGN